MPDIKKLELELELKKLEKEKTNNLSKLKTIKTLSILCLCFLGFITLNILFIVTGALVLSYSSSLFKKEREHSKRLIQWVSGFMLILPIVFSIISSILISHKEYVSEDEMFIYYTNPYYHIGIAFLIISQTTFYVGAIISLIFSSQETNAVIDKVNIESERIKKELALSEINNQNISNKK